MLQSSVDGSFNTLHHGGTWFISCLGFCYFLSPFLIHIVKQLKTKTKMLILLLIFFICGYIPIAVHIMEYNSTYSSMIFRACEFFIGVILADIYMNSDKKPAKTGLKCIMASIAIIAGISFLPMIGGNYLDYVYFAMPLFALLIYNSAFFDYNKKIGKKFRDSKLLKYSNEIAYEFFLGQFFCFKITNKIIYYVPQMGNSAVKTIIAFILCALFAIILHEVITKPCKKKLMSKLL